MLIDPPYELKEDYFAVVDTLKRRKTLGHRHLCPLVSHSGEEADKSRDMLRAIKRENFGNVLVAELEVAGQTTDWGMNGSGMLIVSPPWLLDEQIEAFLKPSVPSWRRAPAPSTRSSGSTRLKRNALHHCHTAKGLPLQALFIGHGCPPRHAGKPPGSRLASQSMAILVLSGRCGL